MSFWLAEEGEEWRGVLGRCVNGSSLFDIDIISSEWYLMLSIDEYVREWRRWLITGWNAGAPSDLMTANKIIVTRRGRGVVTTATAPPSIRRCWSTKSWWRNSLSFCVPLPIELPILTLERRLPINPPKVWGCKKIFGENYLESVAKQQHHQEHWLP